MKHSLHSGNRSLTSAKGNISLSFNNYKNTTPSRKRDTLLTFVDNARKAQYKPAPSTLSFLRTVLSLFI